MPMDFLEQYELLAIFASRHQVPALAARLRVHPCFGHPHYFVVETRVQDPARRGVAEGNLHTTSEHISRLISGCSHIHHNLGACPKH